MKGRVILKKILLPLCCVSLLSLTACVQSNNDVPDTVDEMVENRRTVDPMETEGNKVSEGDMGFTLESEYSTGNTTYGDGFSGLPDGLNTSQWVTFDEEPAQTVASWSEMVAHSHYRATTKGNVYDPAGTKNSSGDLWEDAKHSMDDVGKDIKDTMERFYSN